MNRKIKQLEKRISELENPFIFNIGDHVIVKKDVPHCDFNGQIGIVVVRENAIDYFLGMGVGLRNYYTVYFEEIKKTRVIIEYYLEKQ